MIQMLALGKVSVNRLESVVTRGYVVLIAQQPQDGEITPRQSPRPFRLQVPQTCIMRLHSVLLPPCVAPLASVMPPLSRLSRF